MTAILAVRLASFWSQARFGDMTGLWSSDHTLPRSGVLAQFALPRAVRTYGFRALRIFGPLLVIGTRRGRARQFR